jgi:hypothetical protein
MRPFRAVAELYRELRGGLDLEVRGLLEDHGGEAALGGALDEVENRT